MPTIVDIANHAKVSKSTAWLVLNNKEGVSLKTRQRVLQAIAELGTLEAESPASDHTPFDIPFSPTPLSILIAYPTLIASSEYLGELLQGIQSVAGTRNIRLTLIGIDSSLTDEHISSMYFSDSQLKPDGIILFRGMPTVRVRERADRLAIPYVFLGMQPEGMEASFVAPDDREAGFTATQYLIDHGHQRIAYLSVWENLDFTKDRISGYRRALQAANLDIESQPLFLTNFHRYRDEIKQQMEAFLTHHSDASALILGDYVTYVQGLPVLEKLGMKIPDDVSVLVFDDTELTRTYSPPLTSIRFPLQLEGQLVLKTLLELINNPTLKNYTISVRATLIERESVAFK